MAFVYRICRLAQTIAAEELPKANKEPGKADGEPKRLLVLILSKDNAVEVAADEVAENYAAVDSEYLPDMGFEEGNRHTAVVEGIRNAVSEATDDEERNCQKQRQKVLLTRKTDGGGHHHAATDTEQAAAQSTSAQTQLQYLLGCTLDIHRADTCKKRSAEAADDVSKEYHEEHSHLAFHDEAGGSGVELKFISHHCQ